MNPQTSAARKRLFKTVITVGTVFTALAIARCIFDPAYKYLPVSHAGRIIVEGLIHYDEVKPQERDGATFLREYDGLGHREHGRRTPSNYFARKPSNQYRILCMGGSTTYGVLVDTQDTWPSNLQRRLSEEFAGQDILVLNAGRTGMDSGTIRRLYARYLHKYGANMLVLHVGKNDAVRNIIDEDEKDMPLAIESHIARWPGETFLLNNFLSGPILRYPFALYYDRTSEAARLTRLFRREFKRKMLDEEGLKNMAISYPQRFHDNLVEIARQAKSNGAEVILFPVPVIHDNIEGVVEEFDEQFRSLHVSATENVSRVARGVAREQEIHFIQLKTDAIPLEYFEDDCHVDRRGEAIKGEFVAEHIIRQGFIQKWIDEPARTGALDVKLK